VSDRVGITPKSWTTNTHHGILHLGKRWYVVSAQLDEDGHAEGVRLDGPFENEAAAAAKARQGQSTKP
jgi:hypothetical protein